MGQMIGADPDQLDQLGRQMAGAADHLNAIRTDVGARLLYSTWAGSDADGFRDEWNSRLHGLLMTAVEAVQRCSVSLADNAEQQRQTSAPGPSVVSTVLSCVGLAGLISGIKDIPKYLSMEQDALAAKAAGRKWTAADDIDKLDGALLAFGTVVDATTFVHGFLTHDNGEEISGGVDLAFDGLAVASLALAPEAFPVIMLAHTAFDVIDQLATAEGRQAVADDVRGIVHVSEDIGRAGIGAAEVVSSALSRGVRGVLAGL